MQRLVIAMGLVGLVGLVFPCAGCAHGDRDARQPHAPSIADLPPVPAEAAQVCVVRPETMATAVSMAVHDNGRLVGATRGTTFFCYLASPGDHQITSIDDDTGPTFFHAQGGARYWLHQEVVELAGHTHAHLDWIDEATALEMLDQCDTRVHVAVPGHEDEPAAQPIAPAQRM